MTLPVALGGGDVCHGYMDLNFLFKNCMPPPPQLDKALDLFTITFQFHLTLILANSGGYRIFPGEEGQEHDLVINITPI